jgi:tRNA dimethylallyltransferase
MKENSAKLVAIVGPTATGKSEVALHLASLINAEIISCDSMQVYKDMDIGTDKLPLQKRRKVPHYLIDIVTPDVNFSVALFQREAKKAIRKIQRKGKMPLLVGGSGLYVRAVTDDLSFPRGEINSPYRKELLRKLEEEGAESLHQLLSSLDPEGAEKVPPGNVRRVIRALEIIKETGKKYSQFLKSWQEYKSPYKLWIFGLFLPREELYRKVEERVEKMVEKGLFEEVEALRKKYTLALTPRQALGYKEVLAYLDGKISREKAVELIKRRTRQYAKRQMVWFKKDPRVRWINIKGKSGEEIALEIKSQLNFQGG